MINTGFLLCAGFGTRFQPHTQFIPKPAMPFFNLPIALYPAGLLKLLGTKEIHYNSHHLSNELETALNPYLINKPVFEKEILDSAGGILNAQNILKTEDHFWVANGDSFVAIENLDEISFFMNEHIKRDHLATFFCIKRPEEVKSGLEFDGNNNLTKISSHSSAAHFIGFYILNKRIFNYIKEKPSHIFKNVILPLVGKESIKVAYLKDSTRWHETGSEDHFIKAHKSETAHIFNKTDKSFVSRVHEIWNPDYKSDLYAFLNTKVWGLDEHAQAKSEFTCVPKNFNGDIKLLSNSVVATHQVLPDQVFKNKVLVDASQWN